MTVLFIAGCMLQGCDQMTKHRVLSFFFDGVPPVKEASKTDITSQEAKQTALKEVQTAAKINIESQSQTAAPVIKAPTTVQHPPYAVKMCYGCHQTTKRTIASQADF